MLLFLTIIHKEHFYEGKSTKTSLIYHLISDKAKSENTPEEKTIYAILESTANLAVKFRMNPVSNCTVHWSMGDSVLQDTNIRNTVKGEHVQTTYSISNVTQEYLGKYTVRVINWAITGGNNEATFNIILALTGNIPVPHFAILVLQF